MGSEEVRIKDPLMYELEDLRTGAAAHIRRGARAQIDGAKEAALEEYRNAVAIDPKNPEARQGVARHRRQGAGTKPRRALRRREAGEHFGSAILNSVEGMRRKSGPGSTFCITLETL